MDKVELSISALERTIRDTERTRGPALNTALQRQLAVRREELSVLHLRTRNNSESSRASVIVHTSTPDTSFSLHDFFFDGEPEIQIEDESNQPPSEDNFEIYLDPEVENTPAASEARPPSLSRPPLIEIVDTPVTAFSEENVQERFVFENLVEDNTHAEMTLETEDIKAMINSAKKCIARLYTLFECHSPEKYPANVLKANKEGWMKQVTQAMSDVTECFLEIQFMDNVAEVTQADCKKLIDEANRRYVKFVTDFDIKILGELNINEDNSGVSRSGSVLSNRSDDAEAARKAEIDVNVDYEKISEDVKAISSEINKFEDWSVVEPHEIEVGMSKIEGWKERSKKLQENLFSMKKTVLKHKLDDEKLRAAECAINYMKSELENVVEVIEFEDEARCLYSLNKSSSAKVDYPKFKGELEEDFDKFMNVMKKALKSNKVQRSDQVKIIRDNLSGQPKLMISANLDDVDKAWKILSEIYGGAGRLVKAKKDKLTMMGPMPKPDSKHAGHVRQRVNWLLDLDLNLKELSDLSGKSEDCYCEVFNDSTIKKIKSFFPIGIHTKMSGFQGSAKDKFGQISAHVEKLLTEARGLLADVDGEGDAEASGGGGRGDRGQRPSIRGAKTASRPRRSHRAEDDFDSFAVKLFKRPERFELCRICRVLENEGNCEGIYEDHYGNQPFSCPKFADMTNSERRRLTTAAKMCIFCLDGDYVHKTGQKHVDCPPLQSPKHYTCKSQGCKEHYLVCTKHPNQNKEKLEKNVKFWEDRGKVFTHNVSIISLSSSQSASPEESVIIEESVVIENKSPKSLNCSLGLQQVTEKLKKLAKGAKVKQLPEGDPCFMFSTIPGKTRDLTVFYDTGCSHLLANKDVPEKELPAVKTRAGPISISAAGDVTVTMEDEWMMLVTTMDGSMQAMVGLTCDKITSSFPLISTKKAYKDILNGSRGDKKKEILKLKVPDFTGGVPDLLLGIYYQNCMPEVVHTLSSGLFIARLKLKSSKGVNACIGGPHRSFSSLVNKVGDAVRLISCFADGIKDYMKFGAPKLPAPIMTKEDLDFAKIMTASEVPGLIPPEDTEDFDDEAAEKPKETGESEKSKVTSFNILCDDCGSDAAEEMLIREVLAEIEETIGTDEIQKHLSAVKEKDPEADIKLQELKLLLKIQEMGISFDYRCPRCRNCSDCRNAPDTERISVREEKEDEAVKESVKIDFAAKKITARIPLRGDPNQYLSDNRAIALKVLEGQCKKLSTDEESREMVVKAFRKLIDRKNALRLSELSEEHQRMMKEKPVQHYLPWRVQYKDSVSSPARPVFDASSKTPLLPDGRGGRCFNDINCKGKINTLDFLNMILRWELGPEAFCGDLKGFYTSIWLDPDQYHLQRVLWKEGLDPDSDIEELVLVTLIFGVRAVSALSERAVLMLADCISKSHPRLAELLQKSRFVDDIADSLSKMDAIEKLIESADEVFDSVGLQCKGWSKSGQAPHPDVTIDGQGVDVGGMTWYTELDQISVKIPRLHFSKKVRGKLSVGAEIFEGTFSDLNNFVPKKLTRRQVVSKFSSVYDPFGKFLPITSRMKVSMRRAVAETEIWDGILTAETRSIWVKNFWMLEKLRGMKFTRARVPVDALNHDLQLIAAVDASTELKIAGVWARFLRINGEYSSQLVIGRSLLSREDSSIPKEELEAASIGSNLLRVVRKALHDWLDDFFLISDSTIALCWISSTNKRLGLFQRNRVNQVKMNMPMDRLLWVETSSNPADTGSRSDKTQMEDVGPGSVWEVGKPWMTGSIEKAVNEGILKPISELRMADEEEAEFSKGLILERTPEILIQGHTVTQERVDKMLKRAEFSNYLFSPTKYNFKKVVMITSYVYKFIRLVCKNKKLPKVEKTYKMFPASFNTASVNLNYGNNEAGLPDNVSGPVMRFDNSDVARSLQYWYRKATLEVEKFVKPELVAKIGVKNNGILHCRSRILDGQRVINAGDISLESLGAGIGLHFMTPLVERHSPIALSIAKFIHEIAGNHSGYETCLRISLEYCHILQGSTLFKEISEECSKCKMVRKKYIERCFGPVSDHQLTIAPIFHTAYLDLDGPYECFVPGFEKTTRNRKQLSAKNYSMTFACPFAKLLNLQVIEAKNAEAVLEGLVRLGCEVGFPACLILDQESSFMKAVRDAEVNLQDLSARAYREFGIRFEVAPVGGHNYNGICERKIKTVQEILEKIGLKKIRMHATGLQTFLKLVENQLNNTPLGYSYGRDSLNNPILKIITPNLMKIGRLNSRSLTGPLKFPGGPKDYIKTVEDTYEAFYKIWNTVMLPRMIPQPKWFKDSVDLKPDDVVMFKKVDNDLNSNWTVGQVEDVIKSKDGVVRRANIRYHNHSETHHNPQFTDRAVRTLVRLFSLEDSYFVEDMTEVERIVGNLNRDTEAEVENRRLVQTENGGVMFVGSSFVANAECDCCCSGHHEMSHVPMAGRGAQIKMTLASKMAIEIPEDGLHLDQFHPEAMEYEDLALPLHDGDELLRVVTAIETDFSL